MKKFLSTILAGMFILIASAQHNPNRYCFEAGGPPAGEIWDKVPSIPGSNFVNLKALDFDSLNIQFTGNWPFGQSLSVSSSTSGDTVFFGSGAGILIVDASDPFNPVLLSEVRARSLIDHSFYDPASKLLFLAAYFSGVEIWDLNNIANPQRISRIPLNSYPRGGIFADGSYLYIVTVADGVHIADISDPSAPSLISHQPIGGALVWTSSFDGEHLYVSQGSSGIRIINITDPYDPYIEEIFSTDASGLLVKDDTAYVLSSNFGLRIFDFSDLSTISSIGELALDGYPLRITKSGNSLYIANSTTNPGGGVNAVDISNPANPVLITTLDPPETYISGSGNVIAATGNPDGFLLIDASDPSDPQYASEINTAWTTVDIAASGEHAYIGSNGFWVLDMSDPTDPVQVGFNDTQGAITRISDTLAVFIPQSMGSGNRVNIMDISEPEAPENIGYYAPPVMTYDLCLKEHYAFVACWWDGYRVVDFSDPENPALVSHEQGWSSGSIPGEEFCYVQALDVYGNYLYVLDYGPFEDEDTKGVYIWDVSDPGDPILIHRFTDALSIGHDIRAWGDYVYISDKEGGLEIIDVSDPTSPFTTGYISLTDAAWSMDIDWPYAYVSQYILGGVHVVDVSDPFSPSLAAYYKRSGCFALGVTAWENYALVADGPAGMQVYDNMLATGVPEQNLIQKGDFMLFPNPAKESVRCRFEVSRDCLLHFRIFDMMGKEIISYDQKVHAGKAHSIIDIGELPSGMYLINVNGNGISRGSKFLKN